MRAQAVDVRFERHEARGERRRVRAVEPAADRGGVDRQRLEDEVSVEVVYNQRRFLVELASNLRRNCVESVSN